MNRFDAIVIGAGHNGLTCAGYLAMAGLKVLVLEQREIVGGCVSTEELFPGYRFNTGALELVGIHGGPVVKDLELEKFGLTFIEMDPQIFAPFPDGKSLFFYKSVSKTAKEIEKLSPHDAKAYVEYVDSWSEINSLIGMTMLIPPPPLRELILLAEGAEAEEVIRKLVTSAKQILEETFETEYLRAPIALLGPGAAALDPASVGTGLLAGWHSVFHQLGVKHAAGGNGMLCEAMARCVRHYGGIIRTNSIVKRVVIRDNTAVGVELSNGELIEGKIVVSSADPKQTFLQIVGPDHLDSNFVKKVEAIRSADGITLRIDAAVSELPRYTACPEGMAAESSVGPQLICPSIDYLEKAYREYRDGRPPEKPALWISTPSTTDPTLAPPGKHVLTIETRYSPYTLKNGKSWDQIREQEGEKIIDLVAEYAPNIHRSIEKIRVESPVDLEKRLMLNKSDYYHMHMTIDQLFSFRPILGYSGYKSPVKNLYLTGAGTHPGGSVTGFPGHNAAKVILEDLQPTPS